LGRALAKTQLARFQHPRDVAFLAELPRNAMGKVRLDELARLVAEKRGA
jgi:acyl-coenzyme A synthetase/AMP-(fatty) acid ligase